MGKTSLSDTAEIVRVEQSLALRETLIQEGLYRPDQGRLANSTDRTSTSGNDQWRIATSPFFITQKELRFLKSLGPQLLSFYNTANRLYLDSVRGHAPAWVAAYLDQGKPASVIETGRMNRFKQDLPGIIRPDLILTDDGMIASELDAVPGGFGLTAALHEAYGPLLENGDILVGCQEGMVEGFERMIRSLSPKKDPLLVIVISDESKDYRSEMIWMANNLKRRGLSAFVAEPKEIFFSEEGLSLDINGEKHKIDILYRFFELFDLKNIPKSELIFYAAKKKRVVMTPPPKAQLEEKSLFALFHHPVLKHYWHRHLGEQTTTDLERLFPLSWIVDPRELPPHAIIPDLTIAAQPIASFRDLGEVKQKDRQFVIKPSGFSELAWGSRGVSVGHDLSKEAWSLAIDQACDHFQENPYIMQRFHKGKKVSVEYVDFDKNRLVTMEGRVRLSPYYFVEGKETHLGGVLATVCSLEKKLIHGMVDAVMAPCVVSGNEFIEA